MTGDKVNPEDEEVFDTFFTRNIRMEKELQQRGEELKYPEIMVTDDFQETPVEMVVQAMVRFNLTEENTIGDLLIHWRKK